MLTRQAAVSSRGPIGLTVHRSDGCFHWGWGQLKTARFLFAQSVPSANEDSIPSL